MSDTLVFVHAHRIPTFGTPTMAMDEPLRQWCWRMRASSAGFRRRLLMVPRRFFYGRTAPISPGISLLKRIGADSKPAEFTTVNGHVYFSADDGTNGRALWKTDLREDGTELVPGSERTDPSFLTAYKKDLYFIAKGGSELWVSGGTPEKATILKTFGDSSLKTLDSGFIAYDDTLFHHRQCPVWDNSAYPRAGFDSLQRQAILYPPTSKISARNMGLARFLRWHCESKLYFSY